VPDTLQYLDVEEEEALTGTGIWKEEAHVGGSSGSRKRQSSDADEKWGGSKYWQI
jgi:hypothetical protein